MNTPIEGQAEGTGGRLKGGSQKWLPHFFFAILFVVGFQLTRTSGDAGSPYDIALDTVLTSLLWVLMAPFVAHPAGRFLRALLLNAVILLAVPLGILTALFLSGAGSGLAYPLRPAVFLSSYAVLALPTAFVFAAVQFSLATLKRSAFVTYLGTVLFFVPVSIVGALAINVLQMPTLGKLLDPTCRLNVQVVMADTWTPLEKNSVLVGLDSSILANRLLWTGFALAILAFTHFRFRSGQRAES